MLNEREKRLVVLTVAHALRIEPLWVLQYLETKGTVPDSRITGLNITSNTLKCLIDNETLTEGLLLEGSETDKILGTILEKLEEHEVMETGCEGLKN